MLENREEAKKLLESLLKERQEMISGLDEAIAGLRKYIGEGFEEKSNPKSRKIIKSRKGSRSRPSGQFVLESLSIAPKSREELIEEGTRRNLSDRGIKNAISMFIRHDRLKEGSNGKLHPVAQ